MSERLAIHAVGLHLPEPRSVIELAAAAGGDVDAYTGWSSIRMGCADDHPATLASRALTDALTRAGLEGADLKLVVSAGMSREYLGSWSVAAEVMRMHGLPSSCMPLDLSCGCMGTLWALPLVHGWLSRHRGGYAAILSGERLSDTVDRSDNAHQHLWPYGDGGSASVVGVETIAPVLWRVAATGFASRAALSGTIRVEYGGTRNPLPPPGTTNYRRFASIELGELRAAYVGGYGEAFAAARASCRLTVERLVCNQMSPNFLPVVADAAGVSMEAVVVTGQEAGHVGATDIGIGLRRLIDAGESDAVVAVGGSTPFAFGAALLAPGLAASSRTDEVAATAASVR